MSALSQSRLCLTSRKSSFEGVACRPARLERCRSYAVKKQQAARFPRQVVRAATEQEVKQMQAAEQRWQANVREGRVKSVSAQELMEMAEGEEWTVLDVRPPDEIEKGEIPGSVCVPLFVVDDDVTPGGLLKQMSAFGMGGWWLGGSHMAPNEMFLPSVMNTVDKEKPVVVACQKGLRSLAACEQLSRAGFTDIAWLNGGFEAAEKSVIKTKGGEDIRLAGVGGLSAVLGWNQLQQEEGVSTLDGPFGQVLKVAGFIVILDLLVFAYEALNVAE